MEKKIKKNQVIINDKVYTKEVTAVLLDGKYVPKVNTEFDTYTNSIQNKSKLISYTDIIDNNTKYSSKTITLMFRNHTYRVCASYLKRFKDELINITDNKDVYISKYDRFISSTNKYSPDKKIYNISHYNRSLNNYENKRSVLDFITYTYGFELETSRGYIKEDIANDMGFAVLYDGSITGAEYVSNIMNIKNMESLRKFLNFARTCTDIDQYCSLHIHIGNIVKGETELLSMYSLFQRLTDELNQLIIPYKKDTKFLADKLQKNGRDHCKNLPKLIDKDVKSIYKLFRIDNRIKTSFIDSLPSLNEYIIGTSKWNLEGRYYNINFLNYLCKPFSHATIEVRSLQSTYNFDYILMWLLINSSIIDYAINNYSNVMNTKIKIELEDCLTAYIKDKATLEITLENIRRVKKYFYDHYYLNNNSLINVSAADDELKKVIVPYSNIFTEDDDSKDSLWNILNNVSNSYAIYNTTKSNSVKDFLDRRIDDGLNVKPAFKLKYDTATGSHKKSVDDNTDPWGNTKTSDGSTTFNDVVDKLSNMTYEQVLKDREDMLQRMRDQRNKNVQEEIPKIIKKV